AICQYWQSGSRSSFTFKKYRGHTFCGPENEEYYWELDVDSGTTGNKIIPPEPRVFQYQGPRFQFPPFESFFKEVFTYPSVHEWARTGMSFTFDQWYKNEMQTGGQKWVESFPQLTTRHSPSIGLCTDAQLDKLSSDVNAGL